MATCSMSNAVCQQQPGRRTPASGGYKPALQCPAFTAPSRLPGRRHSQLGGGLSSHHQRLQQQHQQHQQQRLQPCQVSPFDQAWGPAVDLTTLWDTLPQNLFAFSIIPYAGFLYHLHKSKQTPPLTLFGFYFLLAFVFATIPAGIYAKTVYGTALANVDWLHGGAESLLTLTNLFIVLGLRDAIRKAEQANAEKAAASSTDAASVAVGAADGQQASASNK